LEPCQRDVNDRLSDTRSGVVAIRKRTRGWQVIVYARLDPLTGKQRQITRQVNGSHRQAEKVEARPRTEVADGQHAGTRAKTLGELLDMVAATAQPSASDQRLSANRVRDVHMICPERLAWQPGGLDTVQPSADSPAGRRQREVASGPHRSRFGSCWGTCG